MGQHQRKLLALAVAAAFSAGRAQAELPTGGQVVAGSATINNVGAHQQNITQGSDKAIINFQSFGIGSDDSVLINQLNSRSILLGRVVGDSASNILGRLSANGQLFLVNPNGIYFGAGATLDVGGLIASTLDIHNDDFLSGRYIFRRDTSSATRAEVINDGVLKAREGGYVVLAGDYAANRGVVEAKLGTVLLGSANQLTLDIDGDSLINYALNERNVTALAGVANSGQLLADGGRVVMTASTARTLANSAVNNSGVIQARGVDEHDGAVYLLSDGGAITVDSTSRIDVSGDNGGGTVLIGGNFHGAGPEVHADAVAIASGAEIKADALVKGDGGKVAVWSDGSTLYQGSISARGGAQGGNGGFVEVSGTRLAFAGTVDTMAAKGTTGTLLLDPADITITTSADAHITGTPPSSPFSNSDNTSSSNLDVATLQAALAGSNVVVSTGGTTGTGAGKITVGTAITWTSTSDLTLQANNQIAINGVITANNGSLSLFPGSFQGATQSAAINVSRLVLSGDGDFNLTNASNNIGTLSTNANILKVNGSINLVNSAALSLDTVWTTGNLRLNVGGTLTQTAGAVTTAGLEVVSSTGNVILDNSNNSITTIAAATHGATSIRSSGGMTVGTVGGTSGVNSNSNDITLQSGGTLTVAQNITAASKRVTLNAAGGISQTGGAITATAMQLLGGGTFTVNQSGNNIDIFAANVAGSVNYRDSDGLDVGSVNGTNGINTNGNTATIRTGGALTQSQRIATYGLEVISGGAATLTNSGNSIGVLAADVNGVFSLANGSTGTMYVQTVGGTSGINTHGNNFTLNDAGTVWLGYAGASGTVNVGGGIADISVDYLYQGANAPLIADQLAARATHFFGIRGNANNSINTLAVNITNGSASNYFDIGNNKSITVGTVNGLSGITTNGGNALVQANGNITLNNPIDVGTGDIGLFAAYNGSYYNLNFNSQGVTAKGLGIQANSISSFSTNADVLAVDVHSGFNFHTGGELTIGTVWGLHGITATGDVYLQTGTFGASGSLPAFSATRPYSDYVDTTTNKSRAGLMIDEQITATGHKVYLNSASGVFQWASDNSQPVGSQVRNQAAITADVLMISGTGNFDMSLGKNAVNHLAADVNGSLSFVTSGPLAIDQQNFNAFSVNTTITGINTRANTLISGSVATGDDVYNQHNILIAASDDPNSSSNAAITINKSIIADSKGSATVNLSVGASSNHDDALVATSTSDSSVVVQGSTLILGAAKGKGAFNLRTNIKSLSAAGGKYMQIDNSLQTGSLTVLGIGTNQGGGAPTPVGDFYLTTGGVLTVLGGKSEGNYLQFRADTLNMFGQMDMKDGARVLLQPYHMSNTIGVHNAYDVVYGAGWAQTNYTRSTLLQFSDTATIYVGSTPALMNQDSSVPSQVKNLVATNEIHIGSDADLGLKMGYRSLSAETTNKIIAYSLGDVYNLRLVAPTVTSYGFNATGDQVDLVADTLNLVNGASAYTMPNPTSVLFSPYTTNKSMWIGWIEPGYAASEVNYSFSLLDKLDKPKTTFIFSGTTDRTYTGSYLRLAHAELTPPNATHYHYLQSQIILSTTGYVDTSLGNFNSGGIFWTPYSLQQWNAASGTLPFVNRVEAGSAFSYTSVWAQNSGRSNYNTSSAYSSPGTLFGFGKAGGTWGGCSNLATCQGTNPSTTTTNGGGTINPSGGGGGGGNTCTGASCSSNTNTNNNNLPPAPPPTDTTNGVNNNAVNTPGNNNNNGNNNNSNGSNNSGNSGGDNSNNDPGDPANSNSNSGMTDGGPSGGGGPGTSGGPTGGGTPSDSNNSGTNGSGSGSNNSGGGNNGNDGSSSSGSSGGNGGGNGSNGSDGSGSGNSGNGSDGSGSSVSGGSGNGGNGSDGGGSGSGSGSGNGGAGGAGDSGSGSSSGSDGSGSSGADGSGAGNGGSGSGNGGASGGNDSGGGNDGSGSGNGGAGSGGGSNGGGDSGDGSGAGSGSSGSGSGGAGDSDGNGGNSGSGSGGGSSGGSDSGDGSGAGGAGSGGGSAGSGDSGSSGSGGSGSSADGNGSGSGSGGGSAGAGDSGDGSGAGSSGSGSGSGDSGDGSGAGAGSKGSGSDGANDSDGGGNSGTSGKGGNSGADSGDGSNAGAGDAGSSGGDAGDNGAGAGSKGSGSGGAGDSDGNNSGTSGKGGSSGANADDGSGSGAGKGGDSSGGNSSDDDGSGKSGKGANEGGNEAGDSGDRSGSEGGDDNAAGRGKGGNGGSSEGEGDSGAGSGNGNGASDGGASAADGTGDGGSDSAGSGGGVTTGEQRLCIDAPNAARGQDLPDQGGALANRPLLEVRSGGLNMESECSKQSAIKGGVSASK